jgi:hypothetical protein
MGGRGLSQGAVKQPSPKARETRPPRGRVFRFLCGDFEGWARAGGHRVSRSLNRRVGRMPPLADRMGQKSLRVSTREGAGLRLGRARWSGHYPRGRERWRGGDMLLRKGLRPHLNRHLCRRPCCPRQLPTGWAEESHGGPRDIGPFRFRRGKRMRKTGPCSYGLRATRNPMML